MSHLGWSQVSVDLILRNERPQPPNQSHNFFSKWRTYFSLKNRSKNSLNLRLFHSGEALRYGFSGCVLQLFFLYIYELKPSLTSNSQKMSKSNKFSQKHFQILQFSFVFKAHRVSPNNKKKVWADTLRLNRYAHPTRFFILSMFFMSVFNNYLRSLSLWYVSIGWSKMTLEHICVRNVLVKSAFINRSVTCRFVKICTRLQLYTSPLKSVYFPFVIDE